MRRLSSHQFEGYSLHFTIRFTVSGAFSHTRANTGVVAWMAGALYHVSEEGDNWAQWGIWWEVDIFLLTERIIQ